MSKEIKRNKTVLVTGAAGFIGSNLVQRLILEDFKVVAIDNLSTGKRSNLPSQTENFIFLKGDISKKVTVEKVFNEYNFDIVFHLAGNASIVNAENNLEADLRNNILSSMNIVNACISYKVKRLLHASTMVVYGKDNFKKDENACCVPTSTYGITKYAGERYVLNAGARTDLDFDFNVTVFRMFNVYGPRQDLNNPYQGVIAIFLGNILNNKKIIIHGDGNQTRDFIYIDDVIDAWISSIDLPESYNQVFNLGSGKDYSLNRILEILKDIVKTKIYIQKENLRQGDIQRCVSKIKKIKKILNWTPKIKLNDGIRNFVDYSITNFKK